ncbi:TPM domain-containing protein [Paenibacillus kandeliae]|uniref:TPM domain-containing protein n=1 Tax=Paenibacillus kandeliae TaxID=3231269 RepID=UPI00345812CF
MKTKFIWRWQLLLIVWLLMLGNSLLPIMTHASESHNYRNGHVTDYTDMFTEKDTERINKALSGHHYTLQVMTVNGYTQTEGSRFANEVYDEEGMGGNQLLLLITRNPNYVHLVFQNEELAERIAASNARTVEGVTDTQFVPYAKNGDIAGGVIAVSQYLNGLQDISNEESATTDPADITGAAAMDNSADHQTTGKMLKQLVLGTITVLLLAAAIVWVLFLLRTRKLRRRRSMLRQRLNKLDKKLHELLDSELFTLLERERVSRDQTVLLEQIQRDGEQQLQQVQQWRQTVQSLSISIWSLTSAGRELNRLENESSAWSSETEQLQERYEMIAGVTRPLHASTAPTLPESTPLHSIDQVTAELHELVEREQLNVRAENPFLLLEQARMEERQLQHLQARGDHTRVLALRQNVGRLIKDSRQLVHECIRFRNEAVHTVDEAGRILEEYELLPEWHERELQRLQGVYADGHIARQQQRYEHIQELLKQIASFLPSIAAALEEEPPQYRAAYEYSLNIRESVDQVHTLRLELTGYLDELDLRKKLDMERWEAISAQHRDGVRQLTDVQTESEIRLTGPVQEDSFEALEKAHRYLMETPLDLSAAEEALHQAEERLDEFLQQLQQQRRTQAELTDGSIVIPRPRHRE